MKTRNQVVASAKSKIAPETANDASNQSRNEFMGSEPNQSPSPPRLRERKTLSMEIKSEPGSAAVDNHQASSTADAKRPSIAQNRMRRRSCSKTTSLLTSDSNSKISGSTNRSSSNTSKSSELAGSKKDTHQCQQIAASLSKQLGNQSSGEVESQTANNTANVKNYSRDIPSNKDNISRKQNIHENEFTSSHETRPVRISLPDKNGEKSTNGSVNSLDCTSNNTSPNKNGRMFIVNGLKKSGTDDSKSHIFPSSNGRDSHCALNTEIDLMNSTDTDPTNTKNVFNVLIGVTGSVASVKLTQMILKLKSMFPRPYNNKSDGTFSEVSISIKIIMTNSSKHFISEGELKNIQDEGVDIHSDPDEWELWKKMGDPVLHIELRKWADLCLIAPLDANTMAKLANGICDNLLTCVVRAWDISKPLIYCPAMNVHMFEHPLTGEHLSKLQSFGYLRVDCIEKRLACGDIGIGGMATVDSIANKVVDCLIQPKLRSNPLSRPLLDQQPTYPIISKSNQDQDGHTSPNNKKVTSQISAHQLLNRFRTNNQITIHAVSNDSTKPSGSRVDEIAAQALKRRRILNSTPSSYPHSLIGIGKSLNRPYNQRYLGQCNSKQQMGGVTSVQNLKAMGLDESLLSCTSELGPAAKSTDREVDFANYFDPSRLLEQSMIIDDSSLSFPQQASSNNVNSIQSIERSFPSSHRNQGSVLKTSGSAPLFNTSKFLALCQNKERNCFTCAICKHDYKNRKSMARHLKEQHVQGNIFQCKPCGVSYKRREKLIKHNRERHGII